LRLRNGVSFYCYLPPRVLSSVLTSIYLCCLHSGGVAQSFNLLIVLCRSDANSLQHTKLYGVVLELRPHFLTSICYKLLITSFPLHFCYRHYKSLFIVFSLGFLFCSTYLYPIVFCTVFLYKLDHTHVSIDLRTCLWLLLQLLLDVSHYIFLSFRPSRGAGFGLLLEHHYLSTVLPNFCFFLVEHLFLRNLILLRFLTPTFCVLIFGRVRVRSLLFCLSPNNE
jgi:hypothetical protein